MTGVYDARSEIFCQQVEEKIQINVHAFYAKTKEIIGTSKVWRHSKEIENTLYMYLYSFYRCIKKIVMRLELETYGGKKLNSTYTIIKIPLKVFLICEEHFTCTQTCCIFMLNKETANLNVF